MKKPILIFLFSLASCCCFSQAGEWVWIKGDSTVYGPDSSGNFGVQGVSSPTNNPPGLYEPCEWTDLNGNFWLFGGIRYDLPLGYYYGDLWKYDVTTNEWTWMKGSSLPNDTGNYGLIGIPSPSNNPPARSFCMASWTDTVGNLWMFGGAGGGVGVCNDLWKFDISINQWICINANTLIASYGVQGIPSPSNHPGGRTECATAWTDNSGNLWLFGGLGYDSSFTWGILNDLWKYETATNEWTWMKGSPQNWNLGNYGVQGIEAPSNNPISRGGYARWKDNIGNFWLFGGGTSGTPLLNDLWRFNPSTNNWTWICGSNIFDAIGDYGNKCLMSPTNVPSSGFEQRSTWVDANGDFWLFGGATTFSGGWHGTSNDLWKYSLSNNQWGWVSGDSILYPQGSWGTLGISNPSNKPNGRCGSVGWSINNQLFLFGGNTYGTCFNDLWKYTIDTTCLTIQPIAAIESSDTSFCEKKCLDFYDLSANNPTSWQWYLPGSDSLSSNLQNPTNICYNNYGSFDVTLIACNSVGCDTLILPNFIQIYQAPPAPVIIISNDTLNCITPANAYQWYLNNAIITGATDSFYVFTMPGDYYVIITDSNSCNSASNLISITGINQWSMVSGQLSIIPNPAKSVFIVSFILPSKENVELRIFDALDKEIYFSKHENLQGKFEKEIPVNGLANGIYLFQLKTNNSIINKKVIVQH